MRKLKIEEVNNGYILFFDIESVDSPMTLQMDVIEDLGEEREAIKRLLIAVADHFGFHYDPFSKENINITFDKKGNEVE